MDNAALMASRRHNDSEIRERDRESFGAPRGGGINGWVTAECRSTFLLHSVSTTPVGVFLFPSLFVFSLM